MSLLTFKRTGYQKWQIDVHLHCSRGAADPLVVLINKPANAERSPRLVQVAMEVANGNDSRRSGKEGGVGSRLHCNSTYELTHTQVCNRKPGLLGPVSSRDAKASECE